MSLDTRKPAVGSKVTVSFTGHIVDTHEDPPSLVTVASEATGMWHQVCYYDTEDVRRHAPKPKPGFWPPKAGEIWRAGGRKWLVYSAPSKEERHILLISAPCDVRTGDAFLKAFPEARRVLSGDSSS
jgi:hypothetical protein